MTDGHPSQPTRPHSEPAARPGRRLFAPEDQAIDAALIESREGDVLALALPALRHRLVLSYEAEAEEVTAETIVRRVFEAVEVP